MTKSAAPRKFKQINKVPWVTTAQADKLWIAAKAVQEALSELESTDLLPDSKDLKDAYNQLDYIIAVVEADN